LAQIVTATWCDARTEGERRSDMTIGDCTLMHIAIGQSSSDTTHPVQATSGQAPNF
jgi:hypothetical protein